MVSVSGEEEEKEGILLRTLSPSLPVVRGDRFLPREREGGGEGEEEEEEKEGILLRIVSLTLVTTLFPSSLA